MGDNDGIYDKNIDLDVDSNNKIQDLFSIVKFKIEFQLNELKSNIQQTVERIDLQFTYVKEELGIRVESLKSQLDILHEKMENDLELSKNELISKTLSQIDINSYEADFNSLCDNIKSKMNLTSNMLIREEETVNKLIKLNEKLKSIGQQVSVDISEAQIDESLIGNLKYNFVCKQQINKKVPQIIDLRERVLDMCVLPNDTLLTADFMTRRLMKYDENFNFKEIIDKFGNDKIDLIPFSLCTNNVDRIYICDLWHDRILMSNFNWCLLQIAGKTGSGFDCFNKPYGICHSSTSVYVCDTSNYRIQKLNADTLAFDSHFKIDFMPRNIKILDNIGCIRSCDPSIYFYKMDTFTLVHKYDGHNGCICTIDANFYEYFHETKKLYCYNETGLVQDEICVNVPNDFEFGKFYCLNWFRNSLILSSEKQLKLLII